MPDPLQLIALLEEARRLLSLPDNDFAWSYWNGSAEALGEIDMILAGLRSGEVIDELKLRVLFAPTGPIQEVSLSSGWGDRFLRLAEQFDEAMESEPSKEERPEVRGPSADCPCLTAPSEHLFPFKEVGADDRFGEISVLVCRNCGRHWLRYLYEVEAFTGSGRWYLGHVTPEQLSTLEPWNAKGMLEELEWYFYGGSYYDGRTGRTSGRIAL